MDKIKTSKSLSSGFTIIELLIVIVVIGILTAIGLVAYPGIKLSASKSMIEANLSHCEKALEMYHVENDAYPTNEGYSSSQPEGCLNGPVGEVRYTYDSLGGSGYTYKATLSTPYYVASRSSASDIAGDLHAGVASEPDVPEEPSPTYPVVARILVVAGGGGGGSNYGGGGGAGGVIYKEDYYIYNHIYTIGVGGSGSVDNIGGDSRIDAGDNPGISLLAKGGGAGGSLGSLIDKKPGGSGGGASGAGPLANNDNGGGASNCGYPNVCQGYKGGKGGAEGSGGGGGALGPGENASGSVKIGFCPLCWYARNTGGHGGKGWSIDISGSIRVYATGGNGRNTSSANITLPGSFGSGGNSNSAGQGGVVIISYPTSNYTATGGDITYSNGRTIHTFTSNGTFNFK